MRETGKYDKNSDVQCTQKDEIGRIDHYNRTSENN